VGNQWHLDPDTYLAVVRSEIPSYDWLHSRLGEASSTVFARRILDLGSGTGRTAQQVAMRHPGASLIGIDASDAILMHARQLLPEATFVMARLEDPLPEGPFDLVVSAFAIHHLDGPAKADLFRRVAAVLAVPGRFVMCDVVVPTHAVDHPVLLEEGVDIPSSVDEQRSWLIDAGLRATVVHAKDDLAILVGDLIAFD